MADMKQAAPAAVAGPSEPKCSACGARLQEVTRGPNSYLSADQFDADKLGDWFCECCPEGPNKGSRKHRYFDNYELAAPTTQPAPAAGLHPKTADLVQRFAAALSEKLAAAEKKYGYGDGWASPDWMDECRQKLVEHIAKGDPRDVAAYCAFLWHHGESTAAPASQGDALSQVARDVLAEVERATHKFPTWPTDPLHALAVLGEEFGELTKDMLQLTYEPHKTSSEKVRTEALQTAAMALRLLMSLERYEYLPCTQHSQQEGGAA